MVGGGGWCNVVLVCCGFSLVVLWFLVMRLFRCGLVVVLLFWLLLFGGCFNLVVDVLVLGLLVVVGVVVIWLVLWVLWCLI